MCLITICFQLIFVQQSISLDILSWAPVPHADLLGDFLDEKYFKNYTEPNTISVFDYLFGDNITNLDKAQISDYLDICVLSPDNIKKIVDEAKRKYLLDMRSSNETQSEGKDLRRRIIYYGDRNVKRKAMSWMKQSIYGTRRRLEVTRPYRKKYSMDISYNIGVYYGILKEMLIKVNSVNTLIKKMPHRHLFLWFLLAYQRILGFNVDITYIVERMFEYQKRWNTLIGRKEIGGSQEFASDENKNEHGIDPEAIKGIWNVLDNIPEPETNINSPDMAQTMPGGPPMGPAVTPMGPGAAPMGPGGPPVGSGGPLMESGGSPMGSGGPPMGSGGPLMEPEGPLMESGGPPLGSGGPPMESGGPPMRRLGPPVHG